MQYHISAGASANAGFRFVHLTKEPSHPQTRATIAWLEQELRQDVKTGRHKDTYIFVDAYAVRLHVDDPNDVNQDVEYYQSLLEAYGLQAVICLRGLETSRYRDYPLKYADNISFYKLLDELEPRLHGQVADEYDPYNDAWIGRYLARTNPERYQEWLASQGETSVDQTVSTELASASELEQAVKAIGADDLSPTALAAQVLQNRAVNASNTATAADLTSAETREVSENSSKQLASATETTPAQAAVMVAAMKASAAQAQTSAAVTSGEHSVNLDLDFDRDQRDVNDDIYADEYDSNYDDAYPSKSPSLSQFSLQKDPEGLSQLMQVSSIAQDKPAGLKLSKAQKNLLETSYAEIVANRQRAQAQANANADELIAQVLANYCDVEPGHEHVNATSSLNKLELNKLELTQHELSQAQQGADFPATTGLTGLDAEKLQVATADDLLAAFTSSLVHDNSGTSGVGDLDDDFAQQQQDLTDKVGVYIDSNYLNSPELCLRGLEVATDCAVQFDNFTLIGGVLFAALGLELYPQLAGDVKIKELHKQMLNRINVFSHEFYGDTIYAYFAQEPLERYIALSGQSHDQAVQNLLQAYQSLFPNCKVVHLDDEGFARVVEKLEVKFVF